STPELTETVKGVDRADMGFGKNVTEAGWKALHDEIANRFNTAMKNEDYTNQDLANLSQATVRQDDFGGNRRALAEEQWRDVARGLNEGGPDPKARELAKTLEATNLLVQHQVNGSVPPSEMTNAQLLQSVAQIPGMTTSADLVSLTGIPGLLAAPSAAAK